MNTPKLDKSEILRLIKMKSPRMSYEPNSGNLKSEVWNYFVIAKCDDMKLNYVKCIRCDCLLKWKSRDGTSGLRVHIDSCTQQSKLMPLADSQMCPEERSVRNRAFIPEQVTFELSETIATMCAKDLIPLDVVEGEGFRLLVQKLVAIGAKYKQAALALTLPSADALTQHVSNMVDMQKCRILSEICTLQALGVTLDRYPNCRVADQRYVSVTVHFLDSSWKRRSFVLDTCLMDDTCTPESLQEFVYSTLQQYTANREKNFIITDNIVTLQAAFNDQALGCACHNLEQTLLVGLHESNSELPHEIHRLVRNCTELVNHLKQLNAKNSVTMSASHHLNNNSVMTILKTAADNLTSLDIKGILTEDSEYILRLLTEVDSTLLKETIAVLERFQKAAALLTAEDTPTLQLVIPVRNQLAEHLSPGAQDSETIQKLKDILKQLLKKNFTTSDIHCTAALLDPRLKNKCTLLTLEERNRAISMLQSLITNVTFEFTQETELKCSTSSSSVTAHDDEECSSSTQKRLKFSDEKSAEDDFFGDLFSTGSESNARSDTEIDQYVNNTETCSDLIGYWMLKTQKWPHLSYVVRCVLGMPACNSSCGHFFSLPGRSNIEDRLTHLDSQTAHSLLFLRGLNERVFS